MRSRSRRASPSRSSTGVTGTSPGSAQSAGTSDSWASPTAAGARSCGIGVAGVVVSSALVSAVQPDNIATSSSAGTTVARRELTAGAPPTP